MSVRRILAAAVSLLLVVGFFRWWATGDDHAQSTKGRITPTSTTARSSGKFESSSEVSSASHPDGESHLADKLNLPSGNIRTDLETVAALMESFRTNFPGSGNPVGENTEITAALTGRNSLHIALIPRKHPAINARGELCDRWGTPFFFHQLSGTAVEIRSAGPDRRMRNEDDVVLTP